MRQRMATGALAAVLVVALCVLLPALDNAQGKAAPITETEPMAAAETPIQTPEPSPEESAPRTVSRLVVHQAEPEDAVETEEPSWDGTTLVQVEIGGQLQELTLEDYLVGVLMGEMPASFPLEALKAQAVAARTFTLRRQEGGGVLSDDPAVCQAYCPASEAAEKFGDQAEEYLAKLRQAVTETDGQVMTYDGDLIAATYFSCSGGKTESAQAVWGSSVPYLISVDSPGEEDARSYESTTQVPLAEFLEALDIPEAAVGAITYTDGGGVDTMELGGRTFTGVELRQRFGLRSTIFSLEIGPDQATFSVRGYGHRVGLSQYGAKAMAEAGSDYREILTWYYSGAMLTDVV